MQRIDLDIKIKKRMLFLTLDDLLTRSFEKHTIKNLNKEKYSVFFGRCYTSTDDTIRFGKIEKKTYHCRAHLLRASSLSRTSTNRVSLLIRGV